MSMKQLSTFRLGGHLFGVEVTRVQEVIRYQEMTPVPLGPTGITGLINLRGQIVTALDVRDRLGLPPREDGSLPMNVVIRTDDESVSLLVDKIGDVLEIDESSFEPPPPTLDERLRGLIHGAFKLDDELLLMLDTDAAIAVA